MKYMALAISISRVLFAIIFYVLVVTMHIKAVALLIICFFIIECSDILDGFVARRTHTVSDLGKLMDPICDVSAHFLCIYAFQQVNLAPSLVVVIFVLREVWVQMLRTQLIKQKIVLAAKSGGKIKTWLFGIAILGSLMIYPGGMLSDYVVSLRSIVFGLYYLAALASIASGVHYIIVSVKMLRS